MVEFKGYDNDNVVSFSSTSLEKGTEATNISMSEQMERAMQTSDNNTCHDSSIILPIVSSFAALFAVSFFAAYVIIRLVQ